MVGIINTQFTKIFLCFRIILKWKILRGLLLLLLNNVFLLFAFYPISRKLCCKMLGTFTPDHRRVDFNSAITSWLYYAWWLYPLPMKTVCLYVCVICIHVHREYEHVSGNRRCCFFIGIIDFCFTPLSMRMMKKKTMKPIQHHEKFSQLFQMHWNQSLLS